jgi:hypothetical protein
MQDTLIKKLEVGDGFFVTEDYWSFTENGLGEKLIVLDKRVGPYTDEQEYAFASVNNRYREWAPTRTIDVARTNKLLSRESFTSKPTIPLLPNL